MMRSPLRQLASQMPFAGAVGKRFLGKTSPIFMLHRVLPSHLPCYDQEMNTSPEVLDQFLAWIKESFDVLPLEKLQEFKSSWRESAKPKCAITFDDGWQDNYEFGYPLLKKHHLPATIFLATSFIGTTRTFWQDHLRQACNRLGAAVDRSEVAERLWKPFPWCPPLSTVDLDFSRLRRLLMNRSSLDAEHFASRLEELVGDGNEIDSTGRAFLSWDEVREMHANGVSFGSHTENHTLLTRSAPARVRIEIERSKNRLQEELNDEITCFSYPWGSALEHIEKEVVTAGYRWAVVTERPYQGNSTNPFLIPRIPVSGPLLAGKAGMFDQREAQVSLGISALRAKKPREWSVSNGRWDELMRIAYVIDSIDGWDGGGTEVQLRHLLEALDRRFFKPALFFLAPSKRMRNEDFPCPVYVAKRGMFPGTFSVVPDLARALGDFRPHLVQTFFRDGTLCGTLAAKLAGVREVVQSERNLGYWMNPRDQVMQRYLRAMSDGLQCNSRTIHDWLCQTTPRIADRIEILPNFLDLQRFTPSDDVERSALRKQMGIPSEGPVLVSVANLSPVKDLLTAVRAAALVHTTLPDAYFVLIGEGPQRTLLEEEIEKFGLGNVVRLAGSQLNVRSWLAAADLGLLTSRSEGSSNAVLEYMGMGLPAILSDIPANRELVNGAFFKTGETTDLAEKIISTWKSNETRDRLSSDYRTLALQYAETAFQERAQSYYIRMIAGPV